MPDVEQNVIAWTKAIAEGSDDAGKLADVLLSADREDITAQAAVRYLLQIKRWDLTPESPLIPAMQHLFGSYEGKPRVEPEVYRAKTRELIHNLWGFEVVEVPLTPEVERKAIPVKKAKKAPTKKSAPKSTTVRTSKSKTQDISTDVDTTGASSRLKKVIAIQRGS